MKILFVVGRPPWPSRRGDQARVAGLASQLSEDHQVRVVALQPAGIAASPFPPEIGGGLVSVGRWASVGAMARNVGLPLQVALHTEARLAEAVRREVESFVPDVAIFVLSRLGDLAEYWAPRLPVVVDFVDSLGLNMRAKAALRREPLGAFWRWEARRMERWERHVLAKVRRGTVVSERDRRALLGPAAVGDLTSRLEVVPFGVRVPEVGARPAAAPRPETETETGSDRPRSGGPIVLLAGNLGYFPSRDGATWFGREVWPRVRDRAPQVRWWLAGSRIPAALGELARDPGVRILDNPADLGEIRRRAAVSVAPLKGGSGTPVKVLEAMADGVPVVATSEAAAGLEGLAGGEVALADDAEAFAARIVDLLERPIEAARQAERALTWLRGRHDLRVVADRFARVLEAAVGST